MTMFHDLKSIKPNQTIIGDGSDSWIAYQMPQNSTFVNFTLVGAGGGGGNGFTKVGAVGGGGGGGGGSGGTTNYIFPTFMMPRTVYIRLGIGGAAATAGTASMICVEPFDSIETSIIRALGGLAGGSATSATAGALGSGASAVTANTNGPWYSSGPFRHIAGMSGTAGGNGSSATGTSGTSYTANNAMGTNPFMLTGGTGGAGSGTGGGHAANVGGTIATADASVIGAVAGGPAAIINNIPAFNGFNGYINSRPYFHFGGTGAGGSGNDQPGGRGGDGAPGCGGGGGSAGNPGGIGGNGGHGFVLIMPL